VYNPISLNVIRQSLHLSGVPQPVHIHRLDHVKFPTATIVTAYRASWSFEAVMAYVSQMTLPYADSKVEWFCKWLNGCWCGDIFTTDWDYNEYDDLVCITICTRLVAHDRGE
jgi:hypothetical protein